ncbi:hypothetical protein SFC55_20515 [Niallia taxi]|uniref:hypothetical protein n=1 Tax=Niallia taxi TaxID=2499688 RepID=UPI0039820C9D
MTARRRMLQKTEPVIFGGEIIDALDKNQPASIGFQLEQKHEVTMKALDSLPDVIGIVNDIVGIWKIREDTNRSVTLIDKEIDKLRAHTEDFVKREMTRRDTSLSRGDKVQSLLRDLYSQINHLEASDDLKMKLIDAFDSAVKVALEEK